MLLREGISRGGVGFRPVLIDILERGIPVLPGLQGHDPLHCGFGILLESVFCVASDGGDENGNRSSSSSAGIRNLAIFKERLRERIAFICHLAQALKGEIPDLRRRIVEGDPADIPIHKATQQIPNLVE